MKTLYVSDLDGTLLNSNTALTDTTIETINALVEEGMEFTFATARSITSASLVSIRVSNSLQDRKSVV